MNKQEQWYALDLTIDPSAAEAVTYALMEAGALGTEINQSIPDLQTATAYFESLPDRELVRAELADALKIYALPASSVREMNLRKFADQDWLGEWKKSWTPVAAGKQFLIAPPWSEISDANDRIVIRIEPGMAFGTGTHETTRLCLSALEKYFAGGSLLDVGTGTGILAIAAAKLFPEARIEACDTDAVIQPHFVVLDEPCSAHDSSVADKDGSVLGRLSILLDHQTANGDIRCRSLKGIQRDAGFRGRRAG